MQLPAQSCPIATRPTTGTRPIVLRLLHHQDRISADGVDRMLLGLRAGDPNDELLGAWLAKKSVRDVYLTDDPAEAAMLLDKTIAGCPADEVAEIRSLGDTLKRWRTKILAHHDTGASNGPTEGLNLLVKEVKRCGRGFENFEHCSRVEPKMGRFAPEILFLRCRSYVRVVCSSHVTAG